MDDPILAADRPECNYTSHWLTPRSELLKNYLTCPWSKSILTVDHETDTLLLCPVTCKRWGCGYCAKRKIRRLAFLTNSAKPNRWIRLGVDPACWENPEAAWRGTSAKLPELCRTLRTERGECEYLRVTELHDSGWPHYHALLRSSYIPQKRLSELWDQLTGAPVVYIAKIDSTFSSFRYLVKYLTKLHKIQWTDRHVSYSKKFFREEDLEKLAYPERNVLNRYDHHPHKVLCDYYPDQNIELDSRGYYHLPFAPGLRMDDVDPRSLDLPYETDQADYRPTIQKAIPGMEDSAAEDWADQSF